MDIIRQSLEKISDIIDQQIANSHQQIANLRFLHEQMTVRVTTLDQMINSGAIDAFSKAQGLKPANIHLSKSGSMNKWEENDTLVVSINFLSNGKFKFLKDTGYNSTGGSKQYNRLTVKAEKLEQKFMHSVRRFDVKSCGINPFSLMESKSGSNAVMLTFRL